MAKFRTEVAKVTPSGFIQTIEDERRRKDCRELTALMRDITGKPPRMWGASIVGFDSYLHPYAGGRVADNLLTGFSPRKQDLVLYLGPGLQNQELRAKLGKHRAGEGCLYLKRLDDVDRDALRALITHSIAEMRKRYPQ